MWKLKILTHILHISCVKLQCHLDASQVRLHWAPIVREIFWVNPHRKRRLNILRGFAPEHDPGLPWVQKHIYQCHEQQSLPMPVPPKWTSCKASNMQEVGQEKDHAGMQSFHSKYIIRSTRQVANASRKNGTWIGKMESKFNGDTWNT